MQKKPKNNANYVFFCTFAEILNSKKMKKAFFFLFAATVFGLTGCHNGDKNTNTFANCDIAMLDKGKIVFYDAQSKKCHPYTAENDSVVNAVYADENTLYYTVSSMGNLQLKRLDLQQKDPKPVFCTNWNLTLDDCLDEVRGQTSTLLLSDDGRYIGISTDFAWDVYGLTGIMLYEPETGNLFEYDYEDEKTANLDFYKDKIGYRSFDTAEGELYFYNTAGENCLTDQIDFSSYFNADPEDLEDMDYYAISFAPVGDWVLFSASVPWGDFGIGPYCISTWDGEQQMILEGTDIWDREPEWLEDGSLVFISTEQMPETSPEYENYPDGLKPCIRLMTPNGTHRIISYATDFVAKPFGEEE